MANVVIDDSSLHAIGDALRGKLGESHTERVLIETIHHPETSKDMKPKIAKTSNAVDFTTRSGGYGNNKDDTQTIKIDGATSLLVDFAYQTEGTSYDYLLINHGTKYGGTTLTKKSIVVNGDTATFTFRSDGSNDSYLGYYAEVLGVDADGHVLQEVIPAWDEEIYGDVEIPHVYKPRDMASAITSIGEVIFPGSIDNPYSRWNENWMPQLNYNDFYMIPSTSSSGYHMAAYFLLEFEPEVVAAGNAKVQYHKATSYSQTVTGKFFTFDGTEKILKYEVTSSNTNYLSAQTLTEEDMYLTPEGKYQIYFYVPQCYSSHRDIMQLAYGYDNYDYTIKAMTYVYSSSGSGSSAIEYDSPLLYNPNIFPQSPCIEHIDTYLVDTDASKYMLPYYASSHSTGQGAASAQSWIRCKGFNLRSSSSNANSNIVHMSSRTAGLIVDNDVVTFRLDKCSASKILIDGSENYTPYTYANKKMINFAGATHDRMFFTTNGIYIPATYRMFIDFSNLDYQGTSSTFYIYVETGSGIVQWEYLVESLKTLKLPDVVTTKTVRVDKYNYYNLHANYPELEAKLIEMGFTLFTS